MITCSQSFLAIKRNLRKNMRLQTSPGECRRRERLRAWEGCQEPWPFRGEGDSSMSAMPRLPVVAVGESRPPRLPKPLLAGRCSRPGAPGVRLARLHSWLSVISGSVNPAGLVG